MAKLTRRSLVTKELLISQLIRRRNLQLSQQQITEAPRRSLWTPAVSDLFPRRQQIPHRRPNPYQRQNW